MTPHQQSEGGCYDAQGLVHLAESYPIIDVRGRGLMVAVEFGGSHREPEGVPYGTAAKVVAAARDRGLLILTAGETWSASYFHSSVRRWNLWMCECGSMLTRTDAIMWWQLADVGSTWCFPLLMELAVHHRNAVPTAIAVAVAIGCKRSKVTRPLQVVHWVLTVHAGARESIRFLPALNVKADEVDQALSIVQQACSDVFG
jgi:acetylornithine/succinyldiaminopimelate/putrescine aminotransferase